MQTSVLIPAYNAERTINDTLESVFAQTAPPFEILVVNDGSTDRTAEILRSYGDRLKVYSNPHIGVAGVRNFLCREAKGDMAAFIDADDLWHPHYLESLRKIASDDPTAVASFFGHIDIAANENPRWADASYKAFPVTRYEPIDFIKALGRQQGLFGSFSFCAVPMRVVRTLGEEPFWGTVGEGIYFFHLLALRGGVLFCPAPLAAYRLTLGSVSSDRLYAFTGAVAVYERLRLPYRTAPHILTKQLSLAAASNRRQCGKYHASTGDYVNARRQFLVSIFETSNVISGVKSAALFATTFMPNRLRPQQRRANPRG